MEDCEVSDDWSRQCAPAVLTANVLRVFSVCFCAGVVVNILLFTIYAMMLCKTQRPKYRAISFLMIVVGLALSAPKIYARIDLRAPKQLHAQEWVLHALFVIGDILDHAGLLGTIFWDICTEAVLLIFVLDPVKKARSLRLCHRLGLGLALSQFLVLGTYLPSIVLMERDEDRDIALSVFYVFQLSLVFGIFPTMTFALLARSLLRLWTRLPRELPKRLRHRLRYTQWGLYFLALTCAAFILCGPLPAFVWQLRRLGGILYHYLVIPAIGAATTILLMAELVLTLKQLQHEVSRTKTLDVAQLQKLLEVGVDNLIAKSTNQPDNNNNNNRFTGRKPPSGHSLDSLRTPTSGHSGHSRAHPWQAPVWERGLEHSVLQGFMELYQRDVEFDEEVKTHELCQGLVKPLTATARCSAWEALASGWQALAADSHDHVSAHYLNVPTVMVSHCWATPFGDLLNIMKRYDDNTNKSNFFFVDVLSMNQHDLSDLSGAGKGQDKTREVYDIMLEALTKSITVPKRVLLALTPHERPLLLTRCWCLYEIYIAWKVGAEVSCGFVPQAEQKVITSLTRNDRLITDMLATVDAAKSQATVESDRLMILSLIEQAGVDIFNLFVQAKLEASLRLVALTTVPQMPHVAVTDEDLASASCNFRRSETGANSVFMESLRNDQVDESNQEIGEKVQLHFDEPIQHDKV